MRWRRGPNKIDLSGLEPVSREFGADRGKPIDRFYIERFLNAHADDVKGHVLEVAESTYTQWYGGKAVTQSDVLYAAADANPDATIVGDLTTGQGIPEAAFDCLILTQTLQFIADVEAAVAGTHRLLKPGGVVLATLPALSQTSRLDKRDWGDWWRFTSMSAQRLFAAVYGEDNVEIQAHGNVRAATALLYGLATEELTTEELTYNDPEYELLITVRATRQG